jgi:uncharacterized Fe-S center protein
VIVIDRSKVYFLKVADGGRDDIASGLDTLLTRSGLAAAVAPGDLVAVKLHFGESRHTGHVRPWFMKRIVSWLLRQETCPFLTDTNTLYRGTRADAVSHLRAAADHGFTYSAVGAPVVIADGLLGTNETRVPVGGRFVKSAPLGAEIVKAEALISVAHFKGHEVTGFGGTLKNLGMGCAARSGKLDMHSTTKPFVRPSCVACGVCASWCPADAITVEQKAEIDEEKCIGCAECIAVCPEKAVAIRWNESTDTCQMKMVEYAKAAISTKRGKVGYVNFITDVHPVCDCYGTEKEPIVPDIGVLASLDPVAIDQASYDLVNEAPPAKGSKLSDGYSVGGDKFMDLHPDVDPTVQLRHAEKLGMGTRDYELVELD